MTADVVVLGNGPSLRGVDLTQLGDLPTIGMNAAYRHWERIGWYPTHYCCLDEELVESHHDAIAALLADGRVRTAFLTARILDFHPELRDDARCHLLESFNRPLFDARGRGLGLTFLDHEAFRASEPWKVTTGAYAVRYAVYLGYRSPLLLGIDCRYVDAPVEARPLAGLALEVVETPARNPNYFFDDYQQAGDRYQVPNPPIYGENLHLQSLQLVRDDFARLGLPVQIAVGSKSSLLVGEGVFPYAEPGIDMPQEPEPAPASGGGPPPPRPPLYDRAYLWTKLHSRPLFAAGRLVMRVVRALRVPVRSKGSSGWR